MAQSKFITDIPEWFNLENYSKCKGLSNTEWHHQLSYRADLITNVELDEKFSRNPLLKEIRKVGLPDEIWYQDPIDVDREYTPPNKHPHYKSMGNHAISPTPAWTLGCAGHDVYVHMRQLIADNQEERLDELFSMEPYDHYRRTQWDDTDDHAHVTIDMSLPDTEILIQIKEFLPKYRKFLNITQIKNKPTSAVIGKLANYKVLPFLDLHIWELEKNIKIKRSVFAGALSPNNHWGESDLAQKIKPLAMTVVEDSFLNMLENSQDCQ